MTTPAPNVLLIEDEKQIRRFVRVAIEEEGCQVTEAETMAQGLIEAGLRKPDLLILDLGLPDGNGIDLIRDLRGWSDVPVLILSARSQENEKIAALDAGADDYLTKPFELAELAARVRAISRRAVGQSHAVLRAGPIEVDVTARTVRVDGSEADLTAREYALLETLIRRPGRIVSQETLHQLLYGFDADVESNTIKVHVSSLRRKLGHDAIETVRGMGYRMRS